MLPSAERSRANQTSHWSARQAEQVARGTRGLAASWWESAKRTATDQEERGNAEVWEALVQFLESYCQQHGPRPDENSRSLANQNKHFGDRVAAARTPGARASIWWDKARSIAAKAERQGDEEAWNILCRFLENYAQHYAQ
ncbi:hypothetical protein [Streptomyces cahuitamycinicus]|uniref:Uncharacterized protein n=1 Tax=Streptomyces cahuitamycinicus TaxID=2070367 RepID=A0A2N8THW8_9ACTN|nr:hypothetical protein [Streptomyces cahuitamycinicus]PNG18630.1 hypothetical protein C1J00_30025 [Streptomyces cahuitamycinicus]